VLYKRRESFQVLGIRQVREWEKTEHSSQDLRSLDEEVEGMVLVGVEEGEE
jgi:hypothetical protein